MNMVQELRNLYKRGQGWNVLFDVLASYANRRRELTLDAAVTATGLGRKELVERLRELSETGVGSFKMGRHQYKTRMTWRYSPQSIGQVAQGVSDHLDPYRDDDAEMLEAAEPGQAPLSIGETLRAAKEQLASQLGLRPEQIEIVIKH